jgi:hypothetical protein
MGFTCVAGKMPERSALYELKDDEDPYMTSKYHDHELMNIETFYRLIPSILLRAPQSSV